MVGGVLTVDSLVITNTCGGIFNRIGGMLEYHQWFSLPNGDADGDGVSNADELAAGSDPLSATSLPGPRLHFKTLEQSVGAELDQRRSQSAICSHDHRQFHQYSWRDQPLHEFPERPQHSSG
jgi:hypothetical protein